MAPEINRRLLFAEQDSRGSSLGTAERLIT